MPTGLFVDDEDDNLTVSGTLSASDEMVFRSKSAQPAIVINQRGEWDDRQIQQLQDLWDEGHSTSEIGRRLGKTKNAIVGKAHRLDLSARPSPIRSSLLSIEEQTEREAARRARNKAKDAARRSTLPPLPSGIAAPTETVIPIAVSRSPIAVPRPSRAVRAPLVTLTAVRQEPAPPVQKYARVIECQTVTNTGRWGVGIQFCEKPSEPGKPYCEKHCRAHYVKAPVRPRSDEVTNFGGIKSAGITW